MPASEPGLVAGAHDLCRGSAQRRTRVNADAHRRSPCETGRLDGCHGLRADAPRHHALRTWLDLVEQLRAHPGVVRAAPGPRHWDLVAELCRAADARGDLVADAQHAAVAVELDATWVSRDRDFARFPGLRWQVAVEG